MRRRKGRQGQTKLETRNPNFETNPNDQKAQNSKQARFGFRNWGFKSLGLFRISSFEFRILFRSRLGAISFVEVIL
jgi:hypothetical protein